MLVSPKTRYREIYKDFAALLTDVQNAGCQVSGFGKLSKGDWYLTRGGGPGNPGIDIWSQGFKSTGAYIKLIKIG